MFVLGPQSLLVCGLQLVAAVTVRGPSLTFFDVFARCVVQVEVLQDSPVVGGTFTLSYVPWVAANYRWLIANLVAPCFSDRHVGCTFSQVATDMEVIASTIKSIFSRCCSTSLSNTDDQHPKSRGKAVYIDEF